MTSSPLLRAAALAVVAAGIAGCASEARTVRQQALDRPQVVVGSFPWAEAVRMVAGDAVTVVNLTPVGADPHDLRPTKRQKQELLDATVAVVTGGGYQPDLEEAANRRSGATILAVEVLGVEGDDPHVWLDPLLMREMTKELARVLSVEGIDASAAAAVEDLEDLHVRYASTMAACRRREIVVSHEAFGYMAARYELRQVALGGYRPDSDAPPDPARLEAARSAVLAGATPFVETLTPSPALEVLAAEHQVETVVLNPVEGLVPREQADGASYRSIMLYNLEVLADRLDC